MTLANLAALFGAMIVLAAAPSVSVMLVTARSASSGFAHGACAALGVVAGDVVFILAAVFGLALVVDVLGNAAFLITYAAAAYLVWLGLRLMRSGARPRASASSSVPSLHGSFMAGLLLTLADQKAVLFYLAFLPAFFDLTEFSWLDLAALLIVTILAVGGVKLAYAYAGQRAAACITPLIARRLNILAGGALLLAAAMLIARG